MPGTSPDTQRPQTPETPSPQDALPERERRSQAHVESVEERNRRLVAMRAENKNTLYDKWLKNKDRAEKREYTEDPRYLALREIPASLGPIRQEAAGLLHLYEKLLGKTRQQTLELYRKCWENVSLDLKTFRPIKNGEFDIGVLRKEFSRANTLGETGFYYGTRQIYWNYGVMTTRWRMRDRIQDAGFTSEQFRGTYDRNNQRVGRSPVGSEMRLVTVTGWWAHDIDEDNDKHNYVDGGYDVDKDLLKKLQGGGYGDEWLGKTFGEAINVKNPAFNAEIKPDSTNRDNALDPDKEREIIKEVEEAHKLHTGEIYGTNEKRKLCEYFIGQTPNKWFSLSEDKVGSINFVYGENGVKPHNYMYRYSPDQKRIYFLRIEGAEVNANHFGGYIEIDESGEKKTLKEWHGLNQAKTEEELKKLIDSIKDEDMVKELMDLGHSAPGVSRLDRTRNMVEEVAAFKRGIAHDKLETDFYDVIRKNLDDKLEKQGVTPKEERDKYVEERISHIKTKLDKLIEENSLIQEAIREGKTDFSLSIEIADGEVKKVDLANSAERTRLQQVADAAKEAKDTVEEKAKGVYGSLEEKVKGMFKGASGVVMMILNKVFKVGPESIKEYLTDPSGKTFSMTGIILGVFGLKGGAGMLSESKMEQGDMDKFVEAGKTEKVLGKETTMKENVRLTNKRIVIPKGKGIQPGGKLKVKMDGRDIEIDKKEEPEQKPEQRIRRGFAGLFGGGGGADDHNLQLKDNEIVIEKDTVIPKDTVLPKGAKVIKV